MYGNKEKKEFIRLMSKRFDCYDEIREKYDRLVNKLAHKYIDDTHSLEERINAAERGLVKAIEKFDKNKVGSDITYLSIFIHSEILELFNENELLRIPDKTMKKIRGIYLARNELFMELERDPTTLDIAIKMDLTKEEVVKFLNFKHKRSQEKKVGNVEATYQGEEKSETDEYSEASIQKHLSADSKTIDGYIERLNDDEQYILGFSEGDKIRIGDYEKRLELGMSEGQLDRYKKRVKDKLRLMRVKDGDEVSLNLDFWKDSKKKKKAEPVHNPESEEEFLHRVSNIGYRLFPKIFIYIQSTEKFNGWTYRKILAHNPVHIHTNKQNVLTGFSIVNKHLPGRIPTVIKFLLSFRQEIINDAGRDNFLVVENYNLQSRILWADLVKRLAPEVYKHQMVEFLKALKAKPGTIRRYCNEKKEGVVFKKDDMEKFYEKVDKYMEDNSATIIPFKVLKRITGKTNGEVYQFDVDDKIQFPYFISYIKQEFRRKL